VEVREGRVKQDVAMKMRRVEGVRARGAGAVIVALCCCVSELAVGWRGLCSEI